MHPTEYDLKGVGGGGLVVAAGSVRKDGEIYTVVNDVPVVDIPDWLVNWLVEDLSKYRSVCAKERYDRALAVAAFVVLNIGLGVSVLHLGPAAGEPGRV